VQLNSFSIGAVRYELVVVRGPTGRKTSSFYLRNLVVFTRELSKKLTLFDLSKL
jgi:hypothetical protein